MAEAHFSSSFYLVCIKSASSVFTAKQQLYLGIYKSDSYHFLNNNIFFSAVVTLIQMTAFMAQLKVPWNLNTLLTAQRMVRPH